jgi:hypothetical protein
VRRRRFGILVAVALMLAAFLSACGARGGKSTVADNEGFYVRAGQVTYQVELSRQLNPYSVEDKAYLAGLPAGTTPPKPDEMWFVVFLWAKNQTKASATTISPSSIDVTDTQGRIYRPIAINPSANPYAWTPQLLQPLGTEPAPDSPASFDATQGAELLFKINTSAYSNRPLTLNLHAAGQQRPSTVTLDL